MSPEAPQHDRTANGRLRDCQPSNLQLPQALQHLTHQCHHPELHRRVLLAILIVAADTLHVTQQPGLEAMLTLAGRTDKDHTCACNRPCCMQ